MALLLQGTRRLGLLRSSFRSRFSIQSALLNKPSRALGTSNDEKEKENNELASFSKSCLRGVGQVTFINSPKSGLVFLGGLAIGDPYLAALAAAGTVSATGAAMGAGLDKTALSDGLWGYNGCLVGCATAVFISPLPETLQSPLAVEAAMFGITATLVGAAATPFVAAALKPAMCSVPQWTLAFNLVTLTALLRTRPFADSPTAGPSLPVDSLSPDQLLGLVMNAPFKGVSQIFVVESTLTGTALLGGIALYSPRLAAHALLGSSVGAVTGLAIGADAGEIAMGLWGFNSALTSLGVGVFFVNTPQAVALSAGGAAATAALFGALKVVLGSWAAPCLTLHFCITMSGCYLLRNAAPGLVLARNPHSPEKNEGL